MTLEERVAEWPKQWLQEGREQGIREVVERLERSSAEPLTVDASEGVEMTLEERVAEWPKQWLQEGREQGIREVVERLERSSAEPPTVDAPEDVGMTLEERVAEWPKQWLQEGIDRALRMNGRCCVARRRRGSGRRPPSACRGCWPASRTRRVWPRWGNGWCVAKREANFSPARWTRWPVRTDAAMAGAPMQVAERIDGAVLPLPSRNPARSGGAGHGPKPGRRDGGGHRGGSERGAADARGAVGAGREARSIGAGVRGRTGNARAGAAGRSASAVSTSRGGRNVTGTALGIDTNLFIRQAARRMLGACCETHAHADIRPGTGPARSAGEDPHPLRQGRGAHVREDAPRGRRRARGSSARWRPSKECAPDS